MNHTQIEVDCLHEQATSLAEGLQVIEFTSFDISGDCKYRVALTPGLKIVKL